jgi:hypothetical protein
MIIINSCSSVWIKDIVRKLEGKIFELIEPKASFRVPERLRK